MATALDELKQKNPVDMTMLEFIITQAEHSEVSGNAEQAAEELAALRARVAELEEKSRNLLNFLPESEIELAREVWGNTNTNLVDKSRRELAAALRAEVTA